MSIKDEHKTGRILSAQSSSLKRSDVAASACKDAFRACIKGSRNEREKAATRTFCLVLALRFRAIFPRHMVVLVRIPGCSSLDVFARCFKRSPLMTGSDNFVIIVKTALTVCSRTRGARSVKPVTI